ncbi:MAG: LapA family protein [Hormoscilla sp. GM7CHS1pb]|nr:LapA family protein [Hormoscilla sp. GM7CHS1pb]
MRQQINFLLIFVFGLALILFSLENTELVTVKLIEGIQVQAPLSVELILAMGVGAVVAWIFSVWSRLQDMLASRKGIKAVRQRDKQIEKLEQDLETYKMLLQDPQGKLPPAAVEPSDNVEPK